MTDTHTDRLTGGRTDAHAHTHAHIQLNNTKCIYYIMEVIKQVKQQYSVTVEEFC